MYKQELEIEEEREPSYYVLPSSQRNIEGSRYLHHQPQPRSTYPYGGDSLNYSPLQTQRLDKTGNLIHLSVSDFSGMQNETSRRGYDYIRTSSVYDLGPAPPPFCSANEPEYFGITHTEGFATPRSTLEGDYMPDSTMLRQERAHMITSPKTGPYELQYLEPLPTPKFPTGFFQQTGQAQTEQARNLPPEPRAFGGSRVPAFVFPSQQVNMIKRADPSMVSADQRNQIYHQAARQVKDDARYIGHLVKEGARDVGDIVVSAGERAALKAAVKIDKVATKIERKIENALEYSDMFVYCGLDALLFFILSKSLNRMNFVSHLAMLIALGMSLFSILPGLSQVYCHVLRFYIGARALAIFTGLLIGLFTVYPAFAIAPSSAGIIYNLLNIGEYFLGLVALMCALTVGAMTYPLFRKMTMMFKEINSQNRYYFTSDN